MAKNKGRDDSPDNNNVEAGPNTAPQIVVEPDERTRLLPQEQQHYQSNPSNRDGFLSPDDPAVSPYNLWSVRAMRVLTLIFFGLTFLWWVLLLVSTFVSPPGMNSRGSGFFDFAYTTLAALNLTVILLFFSTPSKATQVTLLVSSVLLLFDMIMILAVPRLRIEEGWVGIASVVWALLVAIWVVITDRVVAYGKREEEERLTGRSETRRTLKEWVAVGLAEIVFIAITVAVVFLSATLILRSRDSSLHPPGNRYLVDGDKYEVHLFCSSPPSDNNKYPTVLFEAGEQPFEQSFLALAEQAVNNGSISRYCYSDRPGMAWSDNSPSPFSAGMAADVLSEALARAGENGPWVLASAGVGSIYSRIFSSRHGSDVHGLLLVDPLHEDLLSRLATSHRGFLLWLRGVISPLGFDRIWGALFKGRSREDRVYGRSANQGGKFIKAKLQESLVADSLTKNEVVGARAIQNKQTPLAIVSSGQTIREDSEWEKKQRDLSTITRNLVGWDVIETAPHQVWETVEGRDAIESRLKELVQRQGRGY